ncbi:MAG TPA: SRPBCC domain-containing protein [Candidatus Bathyarchaeia archaeon]|nr:SRPBCC domain-containing protein [Candidatus Bathyarchaeia archaeon]
MPKSFVTEQSYYFKAAVEKVFQSLTDSKKLTKWFLSKAKLVPEKGGSSTFDWLGGYHMTGKVKQFDPNKAISFSWNDKLKNGQVAKTTASFKVARKGKGTLLRLRHTGFKDPEHFADCSSRWGYYLTNLKSVLDHDTDLRSKYDW